MKLLVLLLFRYNVSHVRDWLLVTIVIIILLLTNKTFYTIDYFFIEFTIFIDSFSSFNYSNYTSWMHNEAKRTLT